MKPIVVATRIAAPVANVFAAFTDLENAPSRIPGIKAVEVLQGPGNPMAMGTKWKETRVFMGREATEVMWVTQFEKERVIRVEAESHGMHYDSWFRFAPDGDGTRVEMEFQGRPLNFAAKVMALAFAGMTKTVAKCIGEDLEALRVHCEGKG